MASNEKQDGPSVPNTPEDDKKHYHNISDNENAENLLRIIVRSVQTKQRRNSANKLKRKRQCLKKPEANGSDADDENKAYSRCTISFFVKVLKRVKSVPKYVCLVRWMGFEQLLELDDCIVPRGFVQWIADNVQTREEMIKIGSNMIQLSAEAVTDTLGTPSGEMLVNSDEVTGKAAFLEIFGLSEVPTFRFLGKMILRKELLTDAVFCRCFMGVALACFLCPNSNTKLSTKYMGALFVVENISQMNWSKFVHEWMIEYIEKYLTEPLKDNRIYRTLGGCIYHLAVRLLDFVDFGPIQLPPTLPRIKVWKGNLIKVFSEMYMGTNGKYGAYPIRDLCETCYSRLSNGPQGSNFSDEDAKASIETAIGNMVSSKLKENISAAYTSTMKNKSKSAQMEVQHLVVNIIRAFVSNEMLSGDTEKLPSSQEDGESFQTAHETSATKDVPNNTHVIMEDDTDEHRKKIRSGINDICQQTMAAANQNDESQTAIPDSRVSTFMPLQSVSLEHMIPVIATREDNKPCQEKEILLDLNLNIIQEQEDEFSFMKSDNQQTSTRPNVGLKQEIPQPAHTSVKMDIDVNLPNPSIDGKPMKRSAYLQQARYKYYWNDPSIPAFQFSEDEDDLGKTIEEEELIRPFGMDDYTYNKKIEEAITNLELREVDVEIECESPNVTKPSTHSQQENSYVKEYEMSIQCAQNDPTATGLTHSPIWNPPSKKFFVDLVTPEAKYSTQEHVKSSNFCSTSNNNLDLSKAMLIGRKLFDSSGNKTKNLNLVDISSDESPDVQILRNKVFKVTTNQMSNNIDQIYNTSLSLGNASCYGGKENERPQRVIQRSKFLTSPYDTNQKVTILPIHQRVWEAVTTICDDPEHQTTLAINIDGVKVSMVQLGTSMKINAKVEAWVINAFCRKLFKDKHPRVSSKHFFFNTVSEYFLGKWKNEDGRLYFKKRAVDSFIGANKARPLNESDRLYFPSVQSDHWFVFLVDMKSKNFIFLDSVFGEDSSYHKFISKRMIPNFIDTWKEARLEKVKFENFGKIYPNVPKQKPGNDCGIYTMKFMEFFDPRNPLQCSFSSADIPFFRIKYAHDMVLTTHNSEEDAKFLVCKADS